MQQTTKVMLAHYMARNHALDVLWMQRRRLLILYGDFSHATIKNYHIYSGECSEIRERQQDYPSPLFGKTRRRQWLQ